MKKKTSLQGGPIKCAFQGQCGSLWCTFLTNSWLPCPTNAFPAASILEGILRPVRRRMAQKTALKKHRNSACRIIPRGGVLYFTYSSEFHSALHQITICYICVLFHISHWFLRGMICKVRLSKAQRLTLHFFSQEQAGGIKHPLCSSLNRTNNGLQPLWVTKGAGRAKQA